VQSNRARDYATTHLAAMISLIIKSEKIRPLTIPETLRFDGFRLRSLQKEFFNLVNGAVLLVIAHETIPTSKITLARLASLTASNLDLEEILTTIREEHPVDAGLILTAMTVAVNLAKDRIHNLM
jgi:hypothetical protein